MSEWGDWEALRAIAIWLPFLSGYDGLYLRVPAAFHLSLFLKELKTKTNLSMCSMLAGDFTQEFLR